MTGGKWTGEGENNLLTCQGTILACQGIMFFAMTDVIAEHNNITMQQNSTAQDGRALLCDNISNSVVVTGCDFSFNEITATNNRAMRVRGSQTGGGYLGVTIHDNLIHNIRETGRLAAIHFGENDVSLDVDTGAQVYNNILELNDGNGIVAANASGITNHDNTVTCIGGNCAAAGYFAFTDYLGSYGNGTDIIVKDTTLPGGFGNAVMVCGPPGNPAYACSAGGTTTTSATVCNTGTVVGNGTITVNNPPCP